MSNEFACGEVFNLKARTGKGNDFTRVSVAFFYLYTSGNVGIVDNVAVGFVILADKHSEIGHERLSVLTGLQTVPKDVLEASAIDGANATTTLFRIKIPMIASTITICTFLTLTSAFKQFDVNLALTNGTGAVKFMGSTLSNGTQMLALNIYNTAISKNNYALGQAKAVLFFIILAAVSIIQVRVSNSKEVEM